MTGKSIYIFLAASASCKRTEKGTEYSGTVSLTVNGRVCQRWDTQFPHKYGKKCILIYFEFQSTTVLEFLLWILAPFFSHIFTDKDFLDGSASDAQNFCRNPDNKSEGPWCYTTDSNTVWEYCQLPTCQSMWITLYAKFPKKEIEMNW